MSDLCYNCGTCHLKIGPCLHNLIQCEICYAWGHMYIFCPRGVMNRDRSHRYWALCHNCDSWHLPNPCSKPDHFCGQCGHIGHLEFFCPVKPTDRTSYLREQRRLEGNGHQPMNHDLRPIVQGPIPQELITKIKLDAVRQALSMFDDGLSPRHVMEYMAGPPRIIQPLLVPGGVEGTLLGQHPVVSHATQSTPATQLLLDKHAPPTVHKMTQVGLNQPEYKLEPGMYAEMHHRFDRGDLARSIEQKRPMDTVPMTASPSEAPRMPHENVSAVQATTPSTMPKGILKTQTTGLETQDARQKAQNNDYEQRVMPTTEATETVGKSKKPGKEDKPRKAIKIKREGTPAGSIVKQGPRCAACVKSHKRCTHRAQQSPTPQPAPDGSFGTPSAAVNIAPAGDIPNGHTPASQTAAPDHSLTFSNAAMPTPLTSAKAATTKRKR